MLYSSVLAHILHAFFMVAVFVYIGLSYSRIRRFDTFQIIIIGSLLTLILGIHGISHALLEKQYGFNPLYVFA
jgi:hypothetical protein